LKNEVRKDEVSAADCAGQRAHRKREAARNELVVRGDDPNYAKEPDRADPEKSGEEKSKGRVYAALR